MLPRGGPIGDIRGRISHPIYCCSSVLLGLRPGHIVPHIWELNNNERHIMLIKRKQEFRYHVWNCLQKLLGATSLDDRLDGTAIISQIEASRIDFLIAVPDIVTSDGLLWPLSKLKSPRLLRVCREDEGFGIAAGLSFCDRRALILIQHTGLLDSINALRAIGVEYALPICLMVGLLGKEPGKPLHESSRYGLRMIEPILAAFNVSYHLIEANSDVPKIRPAIDQAYASSWPVVLLIGRRPAAQ